MSVRNNVPNKAERYYYAYLTEKRDAGYQSIHTPQHITLIPPFIAGRSEALQTAGHVAEKLKPFYINLGEMALFGPQNDIPVIIVEPCESIQELHGSLLGALAERHIEINGPEFIGQNYIPHISVKKFHYQLVTDKPLIVDHIAVMHKYKNLKTVLAKYRLGERYDGEKTA